jgi:hypothetical protein
MIDNNSDDVFDDVEVNIEEIDFWNNYLMLSNIISSDTRRKYCSIYITQGFLLFVIYLLI